MNADSYALSAFRPLSAEREELGSLLGQAGAALGRGSHGHGGDGDAQGWPAGGALVCGEGRVMLGELSSLWRV